ncbi:MAG: hypothetical protein CVV02_02035 [Firmicutes bacterium HGW-Firmicutes-7]|nr:MAG: hypothetical protein CVV02_02035 [Firmicutes bacterium HGW-Firmicutes-7]
MKRNHCFRSIFVLVIIGLFVFVVDLFQVRTSFFITSSDQIISYDVAEVLRIIDGDTIEVFVNGFNQQVRFIGVDCPELNTQGGKEAKSFTSDHLLGSIIYLEKDIEDQDKYNRLLRYVWTSKPDNEKNITNMFNFQLLNEGYASSMSVSPNNKYSKQFITIEKEVLKNEKNNWYLNE